MTTNLYHKFAKDNSIQFLRDMTKRDCNSKDEQGMTPTLYAAFHGHLDALRLLCGRGGDPDKSDIFGNTALHLAAAQGHKHIVAFLINFGANIYASDIDGRTAHELAVINGRDDILRYIDSIQGKLESTDKKKVRAMKEKAKEDGKKRVKEFNKHVIKQQVREKMEKTKNSRPSILESLRLRFIGGTLTHPSISEEINNYNRVTSGNTISSKATMSKGQTFPSKNYFGQTDSFEVDEGENGKGTVTSLKDVLNPEGTAGKTFFSKRNNTEEIFKEAESIDYFLVGNKITRSISQPDSIYEVGKYREKYPEEVSSIFGKPNIGSKILSKSVSSSFGSFFQQLEPESSIVSVGSYNQTKQLDHDESVSDSSEEEAENPNGPLERFLTAFGVFDYLSKFLEEKIDLDILIKLTESDLKSLNLPLGPHRKLVNAINERNCALENPGEVKDSIL